MKLLQNSTNIIAKFISVCMLICSVFLALYGLYLIIEGVIAFFQTIVNHQKSQVVLYFVEAIDIFLISLVFLIFGLGVNILFTFDNKIKLNLPTWLSIESFGELKILLIETVVASSFVFFISYLVRQSAKEMSWQMLVLPISIFFLSLSLYLFRIKK